QGQNHINEQWLSYWVGLFDKFNFYPHDIIRPMFWNDPQVDFWYAQNCCIFIKQHKEFESIKNLPSFQNKDIGHPLLVKQLGKYRQDIWDGKVSFHFIFGLLLKKVRNLFKR